MVLIVVGVLLVLGLLAVLLVRLRMRWAKRKVRRCTTREKEENLNKALCPFGFFYESRDDSISSGMYPWQREMGYGSVYDETAAAMNMVFVCEPVYFDYNGGRYLIELWKGQYGCTTGAEIGVYVNRSGERYKKPEKLFYECVEDEERLPMHFILYRNGKRILERKALHWWLTGFCVGMFSENNELRMEVGITFPNMSMCNAFCESLFRLGYTKEAVRIEQYRVYFSFDRPCSEQPDICGRRCRSRVQRQNKRYCRIYCKATREFDSNLDKITYIGYCFPTLYRIIIRIGVRCNKKKWKKQQRRMG